MAIPVYLWLEDDNGSVIKGSVDISEREGSIEILECMHSVELPVDPHSGKITGNRLHSGYAFMKEIDSASPYLYKMLTTKRQSFHSAFQTKHFILFEVVFNYNIGNGCCQSGIIIFHFTCFTVPFCFYQSVDLARFKVYSTGFFVNLEVVSEALNIAIIKDFFVLCRQFYPGFIRVFCCEWQTESLLDDCFEFRGCFFISFLDFF